MKLAAQKFIPTTLFCICMTLFSHIAYCENTRVSHDLDNHQKTKTHTFKLKSVQKKDCLKCDLDRISDKDFKKIALELYGVKIDDSDPKWVRKKNHKKIAKATKQKKIFKKKKKKKVKKKDKYSSLFAVSYDPDNHIEWNAFPKPIGHYNAESTESKSKTKRILKKYVKKFKRLVKLKSRN